MITIFQQIFSSVPDNRASLVHLLSIKDGIHHVNWSTGVSSPDQMIAKMAAEANRGFWELASMTGALKNSNRLLLGSSERF